MSGNLEIGQEVTIPDWITKKRSLPNSTYIIIEIYNNGQIYSPQQLSQVLMIEHTSSSPIWHLENTKNARYRINLGEEHIIPIQEKRIKITKCLEI